MFLALLLLLALAETYRRTRHGLHAQLRALPQASRALRADGARWLRGVRGREWLALVAVTAIAIAVRLPDLSQPMRYDEAATWIDYASRPLALGLSDYRFPNNHLFHTLLVHVTAAVGGSEPWVLRLPAFVAGVALVPLVWAVGRALHGAAAALGAAAFAAASTSLSLYSTSARGYTILGCLTLVLALLAVRQLRNPDAAGWLAIVVVSALGAWTIPTMLYPAGGIALWMYLESRAGDATMPPRRMASTLRWTGVATIALAALLYLPVVARTGIALVIGNRFVRPQRRGAFFAQLPEFARDMAADWSRGWPVWLALTLALGAVIALVAARRAGWHRVPMLGAMLLFAVAFLLVNGRVPYERVWLYMLPFALVSAAGGLAWLVRVLVGRAGTRRSTQVAGASLVVLGIIAAWHVRAGDAVRRADDTGVLRDGAAIAALLADSVRAGDQVIASAPSDLPLAYHLTARGSDPRMLRATPDSAWRLWVVVNDAAGQHLPALVRGAAIVEKDFGAPTLVARFPEARVFRVGRERPGCPLDPAVCR